MPSPSVLEFDELLGPIPGDEPAGQSLPFAVREQLEENRREIDPDAFDEDDPTRPTEAKYADWRAIERLARETLADTSKDLLVAARLTEALTKEHGAVGLADGLHLMRRMIGDCWERMYPSIEDGDLEVRAAPFNWLDDAERGARFPTSIRGVPLVGDFSWQDWKRSQSGEGSAAAKEAFEKAVLATSREQCQATCEDLDRCAEELAGLRTVLDEKLANEAPGLAEVRQAIEDCRNLARQILERKGPAPSEGEEEAGEAGEAGAGEPRGDGRAAPERAMHSRADVYRRLAEAANLLEQLEPHSPIPYLIRRAVELGAMPFPQLMKALIREENVLTEMNRELGIKEERQEEEY
jgi:type VI secretion system protein ImpA